MYRKPKTGLSYKCTKGDACLDCMKECDYVYFLCRDVSDCVILPAMRRALRQSDLVDDASLAVTSPLAGVGNWGRPTEELVGRSAGNRRGFNGMGGSVSWRTGGVLVVWVGWSPGELVGF